MSPAPVGELREVLPAVAGALGVASLRSDVPRPGWSLPTHPRVVVVLVDGLGDMLLADRPSYAPFLTGLRAEGGRALRSGFPSTTATSMGSFGTGLASGEHGMVGYQVRDPDTGLLLNELSWENGPDPREWQPRPPVFEQVAADGVDVVLIGPSFFGGSGLTEAALRGARFVGASSLDRRVDAAATAVRSSPRSLVYLYWGDVDKTGHGRGCGSWDWCDELAAVDLALRTLAARLPSDTLMVVTADHGMVDVPMDARIDLVDADTDPVARELARGVELTGGEPRAPMLYCEPGEAPAVAARWRAVLGDDAEVLTRDEAVAAGWFGPVGGSRSSADRGRRLLGLGSTGGPRHARPAGRGQVADRPARCPHGRRGARPAARAPTGLRLTGPLGQDGPPWRNWSSSRARWTAASRRWRCRWTTTTRCADVAA